jgi:hypothetical protein
MRHHPCLFETVSPPHRWQTALFDVTFTIFPVVHKEAALPCRDQDKASSSGNPNLKRPQALKSQMGPQGLDLPSFTKKGGPMDHLSRKQRDQTKILPKDRTDDRAKQTAHFSNHSAFRQKEQPRSHDPRIDPKI